jgi:hypothetical protein
MGKSLKFKLGISWLGLEGLKKMKSNQIFFISIKVCLTKVLDA